jgi:hypothetical protein
MGEPFSRYSKVIRIALCQKGAEILLFGTDPAISPCGFMSTSP